MLCVAAQADTIVLKNGDRIQADSAQERNGRVEYTLGDNTIQENAGGDVNGNIVAYPGPD